MNSKVFLSVRPGGEGTNERKAKRARQALRAKLSLPQLWESAKYVSWPLSHANPIVRVPRPSGRPESKTISRLPNEYDTFEYCIAYRDQRGVEVWGKKRWRELLLVEARSVARHHRRPAGPITGVYHYERPTGSTVWIAAWYELKADGSRKKRSTQFSYGTEISRYAFLMTLCRPRLLNARKKKRDGTVYWASGMTDMLTSKWEPVFRQRSKYAFDNHHGHTCDKPLSRTKRRFS